jgi:hypothetical protein
LNRTRTLLAACALALPLPAAIAGCGGNDEDPAEVLREALTQDQQVDSGVLSLGLDGSVDATEGSGSVTAQLGGPFTGGEGQAPEFDLDATASVDAEGLPQLPGGSFQFDFEGGFGIADEQLFVNYQGEDYVASDRLNSQIVPLLEQASSTPTQQTDPEQVDQFIESMSELENEGTEEIEGEETIHVSGNLDFEQLAEDAGAAVDPAQIEGIDLTLDFYVAEEDKTFRKLDVGFSAGDNEQLSAQGIDSLDLTFSVGISDVGGEQDVSAPTDAQPLDSLLSQFGASEQQILQGLQAGLAGAALGGGLPGAGLTPGGSGIPEAGGDVGTPGGAATDPAVQECIAQAQTPDDITACLQG